VVPLADQTAIWLSLGLASAVLLGITVVALLVAYFVVFQDRSEDVSDVQRFITLTEEARRQVPPGFPLFDGDRAAATTAGIVRFQRKKAEARRALWASQSRRSGIAR
jgi:hypothetical protein